MDNNGKSTLCDYNCKIDMNFIVICERIKKLQPSKKMNLINES